MIAAGWPAGLDASGYVTMGLLVMAGACLQGIGGIGFAMLASPVAALAFPALVPGPLLLLGGLVSLMAATRERRMVQWRLTAHCVLGRAIGAAAAVAVMTSLPPRPLTAAFGLALLAAVAVSAAGRQVRPTARNAWAAGLVSGLMGTITSVGAPPLGLLTQGLAPAAMRSTIGAIITLGAATSLALLALGGLFGWRELTLGLALLPWVLAGFAASGRLARRISAARTRGLLLGLVAFSALGLLGKAALG